VLWIRITLIRNRIRPTTRILIFILCVSGFLFDADADPDPSFQVKAQTLEKVFRKSHISYNLACHQQMDADPDLVPDTALSL
jgi:hypothetical protein